MRIWARSPSNIAARAPRSISRASSRPANIPTRTAISARSTEVVVPRFRGEMTLLDSKGGGRGAGDFEGGGYQPAAAAPSAAPRRWSAPRPSGVRPPRPAAAAGCPNSSTTIFRSDQASGRSPYLPFTGRSAVEDRRVGSGRYDRDGAGPHPTPLRGATLPVKGRDQCAGRFRKRNAPDPFHVSP